MKLVATCDVRFSSEKDLIGLIQTLESNGYDVRYKEDKVRICEKNLKVWIKVFKNMI